MYPTKSDDPPVATGVPVTPADQYHAPTGPAAFGVQSQATVPWSTGLCDCFDDVGNCCITCWCPCITFGQVAEITDRGSTSCGTAGALYTLILCVTGCACLYSWCYRSKLKEQYYLEDGSCPDCIVHCCCEECSLCQMYRELKNRGFDMSIGWNANMERRGAMAPPGVHGGMSR